MTVACFTLREASSALVHFITLLLRTFSYMINLFMQAVSLKLVPHSV